MFLQTSEIDTALEFGDSRDTPGDFDAPVDRLGLLNRVCRPEEGPAQQRHAARGQGELRGGAGRHA
jgi:hypothetical protein